MEKEKLKRTAARLVADGLRRSAALCGEANRERRLAELLPNPEREALRLSAVGKFQKAASIRRLTGRMAAAHGIGPKRTGRGIGAPTGSDEKSNYSLQKR